MDWSNAFVVVLLLGVAYGIGYLRGIARGIAHMAGKQRLQMIGRD